LKLVIAIRFKKIFGYIVTKNSPIKAIYLI
jgi:hypothetical protein